tara:strand:- start:8186 stop:9055 length:870 start_codon:yes stop_codon:yes gene_type:complete
MNCIEISYIGSACGKNRYESRDKIMLLLLCRQFKSFYKNVMFSNGTFQLLDLNKKTYDAQLKNIYSDFKKEVKDPKDFKRLENEITKKLKRENSEIKEEDLSHASKFLESTFKKDCGINNEQSVISTMNYKRGNNRMYTYSENGWSIKGLHDATDKDIIIEVKTRMRQQNVRKNEYDLYQLFGYILAMNKTKGKIVQKYDTFIYDSDVETDKEYGVIDIEISYWKEKFLTFKKELDTFFKDIKHYADCVNVFDTSRVIEKREHPIAVFDIDGIPHNVNPKYEKIVKTLT